MRLVFLSLAIEDLANIRSYIASDNPQAAQKVAAQLKHIIKKLAVMPNIGKPGRVFGTRELVTPKIGKTTYVPVYRVKETRLEILRVLPGMRDIDRILDETIDESAG
jgi:plasmid stabilization system protein ParE